MQGLVLFNGSLLTGLVNARQGELELGWVMNGLLWGFGHDEPLLLEVVAAGQSLVLYVLLTKFAKCQDWEWRWMKLVVSCVFWTCFEQSASDRDFGWMRFVMCCLMPLCFWMALEGNSKVHEWSLSAVGYVAMVRNWDEQNWYGWPGRMDACSTGFDDRQMRSFACC